jgi:hydrogenase maturation protease
MAGETVSYMRPILVLGLGNEMLKDDAAGVRVAEKLQQAFPIEVEVRWTSEFGLALLDELIGRDRVLLIDSYIPQGVPEFREYNLDAVGQVNAPCPHFIGIGEIRETMRALELGFPREVRILAIPVDDPTSFSSEMSPRVAARVPGAADRASRIVRTWLAESKPQEPKEHAPAERWAGAQPLQQEVIHGN